jgi:hypothetical protein
MDNPATVRRFESRGHVAQHLHGLDQGQSAFSKSLPETRSIDEWHGMVRDAVHVTCAQDRDDAGMLKRGGECDFPREAVDVHAAGERRLEHLHDHLAPESAVVRYKNARHARAAEFALERVCVAERLLQLVAEVHRERRSADKRRPAPARELDALTACVAGFGCYASCPIPLPRGTHGHLPFSRR